MELNLQLKGMSRAACANNIEKALLSNYCIDGTTGENGAGGA